MVAQKLPMAMILEDDVLLAPKFSDRVQRYLAHLPADWVWSSPVQVSCRSGSTVVPKVSPSNSRPFFLFVEFYVCRVYVCVWMCVPPFEFYVAHPPNRN